MRQEPVHGLLSLSTRRFVRRCCSYRRCFVVVVVVKMVVVAVVVDAVDVVFVVSDRIFCR